MEVPPIENEFLYVGFRCGKWIIRAARERAAIFVSDGALLRTNSLQVYTANGDGMAFDPYTRPLDYKPTVWSAPVCAHISRNGLAHKVRRHAADPAHRHVCRRIVEVVLDQVLKGQINCSVNAQHPGGFPVVLYVMVLRHSSNV